MKKRNGRALSLRHFHRLLVMTNPRVRLTARVCGCLSDPYRRAVSVLAGPGGTSCMRRCSFDKGCRPKESHCI
eukprot:6407423-Lingulodinium_polyedra.AAC.1